MILSLLLAVTIYAPGVILDEYSFDYFLPEQKRFERGPPPFARGGGHGRGNHGPPPFAHGHGNHGASSNGKGHRKGHGNGNGHKFSESSEESYHDYRDEISTTKKPEQTSYVYKPLRTTTTTTDYRSLIDVRIKDDRLKRSTKLDSSTTEIQSRFNSLEDLPPWSRPDGNFKHHSLSPRLTTCVDKKFECIPAFECKTPLRGNPNVGFCKWVHDEPYVCCEKPKINKLQNYEYKCGKSKTSQFSQLQSIIGGVDARNGAGYPWMVAVGENADNNSVDWYCGGALIGEKTVITAAHCASRRSADVIRIGEIDLTVNINDTSSNLQQIGVSEVLIHPLYRFPVLYNDIAILYLDESVKYSRYARPVCLTQKNSVSETPVALLTGWGQLGFASERSSILQEVTLKVINNSYCDQQYSITQASKRNFPRGILDTQLCAGDEDGGKDACQGDSGAPLVTEEDGSLVLIGLVSAGIGCGSKTFPGVYTRISAFSPWILENTL